MKACSNVRQFLRQRRRPDRGRVRGHAGPDPGGLHHDRHDPRHDASAARSAGQQHDEQLTAASRPDSASTTAGRGGGIGRRPARFSVDGWASAVAVRARDVNPACGPAVAS